MAADLLLAGCVLGAVKKEDLAVFHDGGGIERGVRLPRHRRIRRDDRIHLYRLCKRTNHPRLLGSRPADDDEQRAATAEQSKGIATERDRRRAISPVGGTP